jgi:KipI family sensor histidine kinase inhibitor
VTNNLVLHLDRQLQHDHTGCVIETVPTYRSLTVFFDPLRGTHDDVIAMVEAALDEDGHDLHTVTATRHWTIPVSYGGEDGFDLAHVAQHCGLAESDVIRLHSAAIYRVYMIGFIPGYPYLGGLPRELYIPRRAQPTPRVEAGRIVTAAGQAAITSIAAPTGWYVLGKTTVRAFDLQRTESPFLFRAGDTIRFMPVDEPEYDRLALAPNGGATVQASSPT